MANDFLVTLFEHKAWCNRELVAALRAALPETDFGQMAVILFTFDHTHNVDAIFKAHIQGVAHGLTSAVATKLPKLEALAAAMAETDAWYIDYAKRVSEPELAEVVSFTYTDGDPGRMTKGEMLAHVVTHGASHRGAIGKMLETLKVKGASDMVTAFMHTRA
jgi:uncharacterized damage-inducible protein DinB